MFQSMAWPLVIVTGCLGIYGMWHIVLDEVLLSHELPYMPWSQVCHSFHSSSQSAPSQE
jgi:hypothetical protein